MVSMRAGTLFSLPLLFVVVSASTEQDRHECAMKEKYLLPNLLKNYTKHKLPNPDGVDVTVEIHVSSISSISELTSEFIIDMMLSKVWIDPGLSYLRLALCKHRVAIDYHLLKAELWTPNACIINTKHSRIHSSPSENTFVEIDESGQVWNILRTLG